MYIVRIKKITLEHECEFEAVGVALKHFIQSHGLQPEVDEKMVDIMRRINAEVEQ